MLASNYDTIFFVLRMSVTLGSHFDAASTFCGDGIPQRARLRTRSPSLKKSDWSDVVKEAAGASAAYYLSGPAYHGSWR